MRPIRNIAILAHVDAGKTTLSERILFTAGEVRLPGNVEDGLATMDYLPEERKRGITIESGIAHFEWRGIWFNFIDTPGHVDFGAEVDMALSAVDGVVLVISAIDGVETQTLSAWKKLREKGIRTLIFINKLDSSSASLDDTLIAIEEHLGVRRVLLSCPEFSSGSNERGILAEWDVVSGMRRCGKCLQKQRKPLRNTTTKFWNSLWKAKRFPRKCMSADWNACAQMTNTPFAMRGRQSRILACAV